MARRSGRRTDYEWGGFFNQNAVTASSKVIGANSISFAQSQTLTRLRGNVLVSLDGPSDGDGSVVAVGLILVTTDALAAGAASVPGPSSDADASWIWHAFLPVHVQAAIAGEEFVARAVIDSKAMRRIKGGNESLVWVIENIVTSGTPAIDVSMGCRFLVGS